MAKKLDSDLLREMSPEAPVQGGEAKTEAKQVWAGAAGVTRAMLDDNGRVGSARTWLRGAEPIDIPNNLHDESNEEPDYGY